MTPIPSSLSCEPSVMRSKDGATLPLVRVDIDARARGLTNTVTFRQHWRNAAAGDVEAIYTFPLPSAAVLLGLRVELAGRDLHGVVVARGEAEKRYEKAVEKGDSAVLLERTAEGLYTVSLGNLKAGETAVVEVRYVQLLAFDAGRVRLTIPTVIAPRYGDAEAAGLPAHAVPESDLRAEYPVSVRLRAEGALASAHASCPTHEAEFTRDADALVVTLSGTMDRDIVVALDGLSAEQLCVVARNDPGQAQEPIGAAGRKRGPKRAAPVESDHVLVAGFTPPRADAPAASLRLKILLDCSGSMAGDSIDAAKRALMQLLIACDAPDTISLARFGSGYEPGPARFVPWTNQVFADAMDWLTTLDADMGGTEMSTALARELKSGGPSGTDADVLLITDGEIWDDEQLLANARASDQRVFVIAVGAAPAEGFLTRLARETGGAIEFVTPGDDTVRAIGGLGARLRQPRARDIEVRWPAESAWTLPLPGAIFGGDTVYLVAGFDALPAGSVELAWTDSAPRALSVAIPAALTDDDAIARIAAARRCATVDPEQLARFAERHGLVTDATSMVLVLERDASQQASPGLQTIKVPQMLAAGWGGSGSVHNSAVRFSMSARYVDSADTSFYLDLDAPVAWRGPRGSAKAQIDALEASGVEHFDIAEFLRRQRGALPAPHEFRQIFRKRIAALAGSGATPEHDLERFAVLLGSWLQARGGRPSVSFADLRTLENAIPQALALALEVFDGYRVAEPRVLRELFTQLAELYPAAGIPLRYCTSRARDGRPPAARPTTLAQNVRAVLEMARESSAAAATSAREELPPVAGRTRRLRQEA